ncbi:MAG: radical SAM protein [Methanosphaera stadtmanae]|nr:radical SAM protein [Methanosphaera stadtmanae]
MHYVNVKSILSPKNGMNLYRGCTHGCIYCDSRSNFYNMNHEFNDVEVKKNSLELLKKALRNKKEKCMIGTGSMTDPYMPLESELKYVRQSLKIINNYGHGFTCITKSDLILRDIDLLSKINQDAKTVVQMTLTCIDDDISKIIEPNVINTNKRIKVLEKFQEKNIPTVVWLCPVLPYITDNKENIESIIEACIALDVKGIICFGMGMTLRDGNREYFYKKLDEHFPNLKKKYIKEYGNKYNIASPNNKELMSYFMNKTRKNDIMNKPSDIFNYLSTIPKKDKTRQSTLF